MREPAAVSAVEHDRDGAVVRELELHARAEDARLDRGPEPAERRAEALVQRLRLLRWSGRVEARAVAPARVV